MRTEEDKVFRSSIKVTLGGRKYDIKPLVIRDSVEWRSKFKPLLLFVFQCADKQGEMVVELLTDKMPEVIDCFLSYARDLDRAEIENTATDGEMFLAFMEVFNSFISPFGQLPQRNTRLPKA